jgi:hypothetical protein
MQKPRLKVYKPGYVGWDSRFIYMGCYETNPNIQILKERTFFMKSQDLYLEAWNDDYSFISHESFISPALDLYEAGLKESRYREAIDFERPFAIKERKSRNRGEKYD